MKWIFSLLTVVALAGCSLSAGVTVDERLCVDNCTPTTCACPLGDCHCEPCK